MKFLTLALSEDKGTNRVIGYDMSTMLAYSLFVSEEVMPQLRIGKIADIAVGIKEETSEMLIRKVNKVADVESEKIVFFLDYQSTMLISSGFEVRKIKRIECVVGGEKPYFVAEQYGFPGEKMTYFLSDAKWSSFWKSGILAENYEEKICDALNSENNVYVVCKEKETKGENRIHALALVVI